MKLLILGSEGFIGGHCVDYFTAQGHEVSGMDLYEQPARPYKYFKISRLSPEFDEILRQGFFDVVVNASGSGNVPYSVSHPVLDFEANCLDTIRILDGLRKHNGQCKYIHLSSAAVYGNPAQLPVSETDPVKPMSPYGWHKLIAEDLCMEYTHLYNLRTAILRPFSVYGPGLKKQLFWDLFMKTRKEQARLELFGTGSESRDFIHVRDLIAAIDCVVHKAAMTGEKYNVAAGAETTIAEAVAAFLEAAGQTTGCDFNGHTRAGDPLNWKADMGKMTALGFRPRIPLKDGLQETVRWMRGLPAIS